MTHPEVIVTVDGVPVSGLFFDRLINLTVTDREGIRSDTLELLFSDGAPHFTSPRRGAIVQVVLIGGLSSSFIGSYVVDRVDFNCLPYTIKVGAHSADLRADMKTHKTRHWDDLSLKDIVNDIAAGHGIETRIADAVSGYVYDWLGQQDESDLNFLDRLAKRHGALFTIKNGILMWLERGTGTTAAGTALLSGLILRSSILEASCRVSESDVDRFKTVKAYWQDRDGAKRQEVEVDADPEAEGTHVLRDPFGSRAEAESAAKAAAQEMTRGLVHTSCAIAGRPSLSAGMPITYGGVRPGIDGRPFILETVTHSYSKGQGLRTTFEGKLQA